SFTISRPDLSKEFHPSRTASFRIVIELQDVRTPEPCYVGQQLSGWQVKQSIPHRNKLLQVLNWRLTDKPTRLLNPFINVNLPQQHRHYVVHILWFRLKRNVNAFPEWS